MTTVLLGMVVLSLAVVAMAVGVLLGRKPIKGSCGGMSSLGIDTACDICGGDPNKCDEVQTDSPGRSEENRAQSTQLGYELRTSTTEKGKQK